MSLALLKKVLRHVQKTDHSFRGLYTARSNTFPIPFFGKLSSARIITIGLNPSFDEFDRERCWPEKIDEKSLNFRLRNYFAVKSPPPHPFFQPWTEAFKSLNPTPSYEAGTAAHLDISPRATDKPRNNQNDPKWTNSFLEMLALDAPLFFESLASCTDAKLILAAGTATNQHYLVELIRKLLPPDARLQFRGTGNGRNTSFYHLSSNEMDLPLFFSGAGPAFRNGQRLIDNLMQNRAELNRPNDLN